MSQSLAAALSQNPLVRAAVVTVALFVFLGAATGALPVQCLATGVAACAAPPAQKAAVAPQPTPKPIVVTASLDTKAPVPLSLTNNEVVTSTFALLGVELKAPQSPASLATSPPGPSTVQDPDTGLQTRVVQTTVIHVSDLAPPSSASAEPAAAPLASSSSLLDPIVPLAAPSAPHVVVASVSTPPATPPAKPKTIVAVTPKVVHVASATITGQGANVRSSPTAGNNVMYALAGGTKVVVLGDQRGWLQVKDLRGRTGWVYSDFVSRS